MKETAGKLDFIKIKFLLCDKQYQENENWNWKWGKNIYKKTSSKWLLSKTYEELFKTQHKEKKNLD